MPDTVPGRQPGEGSGLAMRVVDRPGRSQHVPVEGQLRLERGLQHALLHRPERRIVGIFMSQAAFLESRGQVRDDFETAVMQAIVGN